MKYFLFWKIESYLYCLKEFILVSNNVLKLTYTLTDATTTTGVETEISNESSDHEIKLDENDLHKSFT